jgi:O-antigen/teichoic acid export membrane protein
MNRASLKIRFFITAGANVIRAMLSFGAGIVIARALGPSKYGDFSFLLGSFIAIADLVNMASSAAFYTFISQRQRGRQFFFYYSCWVLIQLFVLLVLVWFLPESAKARIWLGHPTSLIVLALSASFAMNQIWQYVGHIGESIRDTAGVQVRNLVLAGAYVTLILVLSHWNLVGIRVLFVLNIVLYLSFAVLYGLRLYRQGVFASSETENFRGVVKEFATYCWPLILAAWVGFLYSFADYWLLQKFGGAVQQGYYAIGAKFSALSLIATTSMLQVFWKEIAEANSQGNLERVRQLYRMVSRGLFFGGAAISCVMIPFSREILALFLGPSYQDAWLPLSLMFFYPIHQSIGRITGTMLTATGQTKIQSAIGIVFMIVSIPITYIMLAPPSAIVPGLQLGALGLALKMVGAQVWGVNTSAFFVARYTQTVFDWRHQFYVLFLLLPIGFLSKFFAAEIFGFVSISEYPIFLMIVSGIFYVMCVAVVVYRLPSLVGLSHEQIHQGGRWLQTQIRMVRQGLG